MLHRHIFGVPYEDCGIVISMPGLYLQDIIVSQRGRAYRESPPTSLWPSLLEQRNHAPVPSDDHTSIHGGHPGCHQRQQCRQEQVPSTRRDRVFGDIHDIATDHGDILLAETASSKTEDIHSSFLYSALGKRRPSPCAREWSDRIFRHM